MAFTSHRRPFHVGSFGEAGMLFALTGVAFAVSPWFAPWSLLIGAAIAVVGAWALAIAVHRHRRYPGQEKVIHLLWDMANAWPDDTIAVDQQTGREITVERQRGSRIIAVTDPLEGPDAVDPDTATVTRYKIGEGWAPVPPPLYRHISGVNEPAPRLRLGSRPARLPVSDFLKTSGAVEVELDELTELRDLLDRLFADPQPSKQKETDMADATEDSAEFDTSIDVQSAALDLANAVQPFDSAMLARASSHQRAAQLHARHVLYDFVDSLWDDIKARGLNKTDPEYSGIAGLRDLASELVGAAELALRDAGEDIDPHEYDPEETRRAEQERKQAFREWLSQASVDQMRAAQSTANPNDVLDLAVKIESP